MAKVWGQIWPSKTGKTWFVRLDEPLGDDTTFVAVDQRAIANSRNVSGPDGGGLRMEHLVKGLRVRADVRGGRLDKFEEVQFDDELARAARARAREQEQEAEQVRETQRRREARAAVYAGGRDVNPYTFLPYLSRRAGDDAEGFLTRPRHRTAPQPATVSGRLQLRLRVATPLATYGGEAQVDATHRPKSDDRAPNGFLFEPTSPSPGAHRRTALLRDAGGGPTIAGSAIKGVLRSWFEVLTNSEREIDTSGIAWRDTVLDDSKRSLAVAYLYDVGEDGTETPRSEPVRARSDGSWPRDVVVRVAEVGWQRPCAASGNPRAMAESWAEALAEQWRPANGDRYGHGVTLVHRHDDGRRARLQVGLGVGRRPTAGLRVVEVEDDWTTTTDGTPVPDPTAAVEVPRAVMERWYEANRNAGDNQNRKNGTFTAADRKVRLDPPEASVLTHGQLVFVERHGTELRYLGVIRNGRWAITAIPDVRYPTAPLPNEDDRLDPARRVFGTVPPGRDDRAEAWAGRVRISDVRYEGAGATRSFTLLPLQSPKVQAAGYYLDGGGDPVSWKRGEPGKLRGTKVYWHQPDLPDGDGEVEVGSRVAAVGVADGIDGRPALMTSNATVEALTDGTFEVDIWFEDLDDDELGALLLATSLQLHGAASDERGWKLGMGKPLGLGSVVNEVAQLALVDREATSPTTVPLRAVPDDELSSMLSAARRTWLGHDAATAQVIDHIARLDAVELSPVGYQRLGEPGRAAQNFKPTETAAQVLGLS